MFLSIDPMVKVQKFPTEKETRSYITSFKQFFSFLSKQVILYFSSGAKDINASSNHAIQKIYYS